MINLSDKTQLEEHFNKYPDTTLFPVLADIYLREEDLEHARGVCEIGLESHPDLAEGAFVLAKIEIAEKNLLQAEKQLKFVMKKNPVHVNSMRLLIDIQTTIMRSNATIRKTINHLLELYPEDKMLNRWLDQHQFDEPDPPVIEPDESESENSEIDDVLEDNPELEEPESENLLSDELIKENLEIEPVETVEQVEPVDQVEQVEPVDQVEMTNEKTAAEVAKIQDSKINISSRMATFTLAQVFKRQENYHQALEILRLLEEKGEDIKRIIKERDEIYQLMKEQENE